MNYLFLIWIWMDQKTIKILTWNWNCPSVLFHTEQSARSKFTLEKASWPERGYVQERSILTMWPAIIMQHCTIKGTHSKCFARKALFMWGEQEWCAKLLCPPLRKLARYDAIFATSGALAFLAMTMDWVSYQKPQVRRLFVQWILFIPGGGEVHRKWTLKGHFKKSGVYSYCTISVTLLLHLTH